MELLQAVRVKVTEWALSDRDDRAGAAAISRLELTTLPSQPWRALVRERLIDRLALTATSLPEPGDRTLPLGYARGYQQIAGKVVDPSLIDSSMAGAAGGHALMTTTEDLAAATLL